MDDSRFPFDEKKQDGGAGPAEPEAGSVTSMFATAAPPKDSATTEDLLAELLKPKTPPMQTPSPVLPGPAPVAAPPAAFAPPADAFEKLVPEPKREPGDVTRMLEQLQSASQAAYPPLKPSPPRSPAPPAAAPLTPGEFTQIFRQLPTPQPKAAQPVPQMPSAAPPQPPSAPSPVPPPASPQVAPVQSAQPGEFTQFLQKMSGAESGQGASTPAAPSAGGSFGLDELLGAPRPPALNPVYAPPTVPTAPSSWPESAPADRVIKSDRESGTPGSFTQLFQAVSQGSAAKPAPAPVEPPAPPSAPASSPGSFTQMFQTLSANPEPSRQAPLQPVQETPKAAPANQSGFTQIFDSLSIAGSPHQASSAPAPLDAPFSLPGAPASQPLQGGAGEFTRLMRTLSADPPSSAPLASPPSTPFAPGAATPPMASPLVQPMPQAGPGEYTRIISGSALREAGGGQPFPPMAPAAAAPPQPGRPAFAAPLVPMTPPPHPVAPAMHPPAAPAGFGMPQPFAPPAPPAAAPAPPSKIQQYLPLILVLNVALLLIVVIVLVFALRHH